MFHLKNSTRLSSLLLALVLFVPSSALAVGISDALSVRSTFTFGDVDQNSYDGPGFDTFQYFAPFASSDILAIDSFTPGSEGATLEFTMLSEVCGYCGGDPLFTDQFGIIDADGNFTSVIDAGTSIPGDTGTITQAAGEEFTFGLQSPDTLFSSIDSDNVDGEAHIIAARVETAGTVVLDNADLFGATLSFDLLVGDIIIFIEDLMKDGNTVPWVPDASDFDYNDLVFVVRETQNEVPEPSTVVLLAISAAGLLRVRAKREIS